MVSAAVVEDSRILGEVSVYTRQGHMERLLPVVDQLLSGLGLGVQDADAFAVATGPGSFTSLRIGLATTKALAHSLEKPLIGVPTLDALAHGLHGAPGLVCPVLGARAQEVYASFYVSARWGMKRLSGYLALDPRQLANCLRKELRSEITFTGEGALQYWNLFQDALNERATLAGASQIWPRAALVAFIGQNRLEQQKDTTEQTAVHALYVKPPAIRRS